ncbi:MAG: hypothetical protein ACREYF_21885 [Gammaproteobacteria bacterium]
MTNADFEKKVEAEFSRMIDQVLQTPGTTESVESSETVRHL